MALLEQILLPFITALATAAIALYGFWERAKADLMKEFESRFNEKKWDAYLRFVRLFPTMDHAAFVKKLNANNLYPEVELKLFENDTEIDKVLNEIESEIYLIGSDTVLYQYQIWRNAAHEFGHYDDGVKKLRIDLVNAMRQDLGKSTANIDFSRLETISHEYDNP